MLNLSHNALVKELKEELKDKFYIKKIYFNA